MAAPRSKKKTVAIVNHNPAFLALMRSLLAEQDYRVTLCRADASPYRAIKAAMPDLVILDVRANGFPDWHLLTMIKLDPATTGVPVLVCSTAAPEVVAAAARMREHGCEVLLKPFTSEELLRAVRRLTGRALEAQAA